MSDSKNAWRRRKYKEWRDQGLCGKCGKRWAEAGRSKCRICRLAIKKSANAEGRPEALAEYKRQKKAERKAQGLCINCGKPLKEKELGKNTQCETCRKKERERRQVRKLRERIHAGGR